MLYSHFRDADHEVDRDDAFKVLYGVEAYLVDDLIERFKMMKDKRLMIRMLCLTWRRQELVLKATKS